MFYFGPNLLPSSLSFGVGPNKNMSSCMMSSNIFPILQQIRDNQGLIFVTKIDSFIFLSLSFPVVTHPNIILVYYLVELEKIVEVLQIKAYLYLKHKANFFGRFLLINNLSIAYSMYKDLQKHIFSSCLCPLGCILLISQRDNIQAANSHAVRKKKTI